MAINASVYNCFVWWPGMAINVSVQYNGGFLPDIIMLIQGYYHRETRLYATGGLVLV